MLLVEGVDDCHLIMALCARRDVPQTFGLFECGGWEPAIARMNALILARDRPDRIGIVIDADDAGVSARWNAIKARLAAYELDLPEDLPKEGLVVEHEELPALAVWIMPDNVGNGALEDFCSAMAEPSSFTEAEGAVSRAEDAGVTRFRAAHRKKAVVETYLAWQDPPGLKLGQAVTAQVLETDGELTVLFVNWLERAFPAGQAVAS